MTARIGVIATAPAVDRTHIVAALQPGAIHRPSAVLARAGGKGFNVAYVLRTLGADVTVSAPLAGAGGRWLAEQATASGLDVRPTWIAGDVRTCLSVFAEADASLTEFYEPPPPVAQADWDRFVGDALAAMAAADPALVAVSGKLPAGLALDGLALLIAGLAAQGRPVALDAAGPGVVEAVRALPRDALVKINAHEAAAWSQASVTTPDVVRAVRLAMDVETLVVTQGPDGAIASTPTATWRLGTVPVSGNFPVGSGDAFLAGMLAARAAGAPVEEQLREGAGAGAANTEQPGAGVVDPVRARELARIVPLSTSA